MIALKDEKKLREQINGKFDNIQIVLMKRKNITAAVYFYARN
jgi:hypothetical protein